jgi:hypothetical protein
MPVSNLSAPAIFGFFATSPDIARHFRMRPPPQLPFLRLVTNIFNAKARGRNRNRSCPQITFTTYYVAGINADIKNRNSSSASICVICGPRPFP